MPSLAAMRLVLDARTAALAASIDNTASLDPRAEVARALSDHREVISSHEHWAMNLFVTKASQLERMAAAATMTFRRGDAPIRVGVIADLGLGPAVALITDFHQEMAPALEVARVDFAATKDDIGHVVEAAVSLDQDTSCFVRLAEPATPETTRAIHHALVEVGRSGGISLAGASTAFVSAAIWEGSYGSVPFIATAGVDAPFTMSGGDSVGIVNTIVASAAAESGESRDTVEEIVADTRPDAFTTGASAWSWCGLPFPGSSIRRSRMAGLLSVGSPDPSDLIERLAAADTLGAGT